MIPDFDHNNVLPPYLGDSAVQRNLVSPYKSDICELCRRFAITPERIEILKGFVQFRIDCITKGIVLGFQWLDGSFMEDIEQIENRPPHDIDVVSLFWMNDKNEEVRILNSFPVFANSIVSKSTYHVDHYLIPLNSSVDLVVDFIRYWLQLFGHNRAGVWKGMVEIPLYDNTVLDEQAMNFLKSL